MAQARGNTDDAFWSGGQKGPIHQAPVANAGSSTVLVAPTGPNPNTGAPGGGSSGGGGGGGGGGGISSAQAAANAAAKAAARRENENTAALAQGQYDLLGGFGKARDTKLANIAAALKAGQDLLMKNYG